MRFMSVSAQLESILLPYLALRLPSIWSQESRLPHPGSSQHGDLGPGLDYGSARKLVLQFMAEMDKVKAQIGCQPCVKIQARKKKKKDKNRQIVQGRSIGGATGTNSRERRFESCTNVQGPRFSAREKAEFLLVDNFGERVLSPSTTIMVLLLA